MEFYPKKAKQRFNKFNGIPSFGRLGFSRLFLYLLTLFFLFVCPVQAMADVAATVLPTEGVVTSGAAKISSSGAVMNVNQATDKAIINWNAFNVGLAATVNFVQPSPSAVALNRVTSTDPSQIFGTLNANGKVILINPAGVIFGPDSKVNVGSLIASTMNVSDNDFLAGKYVFSRGNSTGTILNQGTLTAVDGGIIALLASTVENEGIIEANIGSVVMASGEKITLDFNGDNLINVTADASTVNALVENKKMIRVNGGQVYMLASAATKLVGNVVNTGSIAADSVVKQGGKVYLTASSKIDSSGLIDVSGAVEIKGKQINLSGPKEIIPIPNKHYYIPAERNIDWDATFTWSGSGNNNNWNTGSNWLGGSAPSSNDDLVFPINASRFSNNNNFATNTAFNSITISGSGYTLGGNRIRIGSGGITDSSASGTANTISLRINLNVAAVPISVTSAARTLTISGIISGSNAMTKSGLGALVLSNANTNTYSGGVTLNAGTLNINSATALGTGTFTLNGGTAIAGTGFSVGGDWINNGSTFTPGANTVTFDGSAAQIIGGSSATQFNNLIINNVNNVILNSNITLSGTFTRTSGRLVITAVAVGNNKSYDGNTTATVILTPDYKIVNDVFALSGSSSFADKNVGNDKTITVSGITLSGTDAENYILSSTGATTTANIIQVPLTITAKDISKPYGTTYTFAGTEFTTGAGQLFVGDFVTSVTLVSAGAAASAPVFDSPYSIAPSDAMGAGLGNYNISYVSGWLTVTGGGNTIPPVNAGSITAYIDNLTSSISNMKMSLNNLGLL